MRSRKQGSMAKQGLTAAAIGGLFALVAYLPGPSAEAQQIHRNGFAGRQTAWLRGENNVRAEEKVHELSEQFAHSLPTSEHIQLVCPQAANENNAAPYYYPTAPAPVTDELSASVWVKATKSGVRLEARLVLPKERNPQQPDEPLTATLSGDIYKLTGRWQRLDLARPVKLMKDQQQILRTQLRRDVDLTDAYIDRLTLNLFTTPGQIDVFIDDLEIGPVKAQQAPPKPATGDVKGTPTGSGNLAPPPLRNDRGIAVQLKGDRLTVGGKPFFFRAVRYSNTPLKTLRDAEFNTIWFDSTTPTDTIEEAITQGFWIVPSIPLVGEARTTDGGGQAPGALTSRGGAEDLATARDAQSLATAVGRFLSGDSVLFWDLGGAG